MPSLADMQALAGGLFNMLAQGLQKCRRRHHGHDFTANRSFREAHRLGHIPLLHGYKAGWRCNFALGCTAGLVSPYGLRSVGKLGMKRD